ncbi:MAG: protoporphyrinogen oxidase [bacterium]
MSSESKTRVVIIGGGISGLATAYFILNGAVEAEKEIDLCLLEKDSRPGGKFIARREQGYTVEGGPNGFLDSKPWTLDLVRSLGLENALLPSSESARKRFIFSREKLVRLPESIPSFIKSPLISIPGKARFLGELIARPTSPGTDTTVAEFGRRRLGQEAVDRILDPMVSGIFAGDPYKMSLRASFPRIADLEEQYGSLFRALVSLASEKKRAKRRGDVVVSSSGPAGPGGVLTSFKGSISDLTDRLAAELGERVRISSAASRITFDNGSYSITATDQIYHADAVVLAVPAYEAAGLLADISPRASELLVQIPYSPMAIVGLGYSENKLGSAPDGFGYLIPGVEERRILGALWTSSIFPGYRAPEGKVLLRVMVGGARDRETPGLPDDELMDTVVSELHQTMGISVEPEFSTIFRWERAIPLYTLNHLGRLAEAESDLPEGIFLSGNAYRGVGINDCVRESEKTALKVVEVTL